MTPQTRSVLVFSWAMTNRSKLLSVLMHIHFLLVDKWWVHSSLLLSFVHNRVQVFGPEDSTNELSTCGPDKQNKRCEGKQSAGRVEEDQIGLISFGPETVQQIPTLASVPSIYSRIDCRRRTWSLAHQHCVFEPENDKNKHKQFITACSRAPQSRL